MSHCFIVVTSVSNPFSIEDSTFIRDSNKTHTREYVLDMTMSCEFLCLFVELNHDWRSTFTDSQNRIAPEFEEY